MVCRFDGVWGPFVGRDVLTYLYDHIPSRHVEEMSPLGPPEKWLERSAHSALLLDDAFKQHHGESSLAEQVMTGSPRFCIDQRHVADCLHNLVGRVGRACRGQDMRCL